MNQDHDTLRHLARALISFPRGMQNTSRKRIQLAGMIAEYNNVIENCVKNGDTKSIPYFELVDTEEFEEGAVIEEYGARDGHTVHRIASNALATAIRPQIKSIFDAIQKHHDEREGFTPINAKMLTPKGLASIDNATGFANRAINSTIDYGKPIRKLPNTKRTGRDNLHDGRLLHRAAEGTAYKELWHYLQNLVLEDNHNLSPDDWLTQLRLLSGKSIVEMQAALGFRNIQGSNYSKIENGAPLLRRHAHTILDENLLDLPTDEKTGKVRSDISEIFLHKFGYFSGVKEQLAEAIKAMAIEHARHIAHGDNPKTSNIVHLANDWDSDAETIFDDGKGYSRSNIVLELMEHRKSLADIKNDAGTISMARMRQDNPELSISTDADYLSLLPPSNGSDKLLIDRALSQQLAHSLVFEIAEHAPDISTFLNRYWLILNNGPAPKGAGIKEIGEKLGGISESFVSLLLNGELSSTRNKHDREAKTLESSRVIIDKIIATNAFNLPTGNDGNVHPDVVEAIWALFKKERYTSPFVDMVDAAKVVSIQFPKNFSIEQEDTLLEIKTPALNAPASKAWMQYWSELSAKEKESSEIKIGDNIIRTWRDPYGHLQVHRHDVATLKKSSHYRGLLKSASQQQR